jgi:hypothetical protein
MPGYVPLAEGERWIMLEGDNAALFDPTALAIAVLTEDAALERASRSTDPELQELALRAHLSRARKETEAASSDAALRSAHEHCLVAARLAEARYPTFELEVTPAPTPGTAGQRMIGAMLLSRSEGGAYVWGTVPGSPAAAAGLVAGDILVQAGGVDVKTLAAVVGAVSRGAPGEPVKLRFLRDAPSRVPELPLVCGLLEQRLGMGERAKMNLGRWLAANPDADQAPAVRALLQGR